MFRRLSLTSRLTIFFIALASSVILGLALLFMVEADRHFVDLDSAALDDKKHLIEGILASSRFTLWSKDRRVKSCTRPTDTAARLRKHHSSRMTTATGFSLGGVAVASSMR